MKAWPRHAAIALLLAALAGCGGGGGGGAPAATVPAVPADEVGLTRLEVIGKRIFSDTSLSNPVGFACASCHDPANAFLGNAGSLSGVASTADRVGIGLRNTPTAMYTAFTPPFTLTNDGARQVAHGGLFLDGRAASLEEQARAPFVSAQEMNLASEADLANRLANAAYAPLMAAEFGADVFASATRAVDAAARAIAAFERTPALSPFSSKFDNVLAGQATFTAQEQEGFDVFFDEKRGNCVRCHAFRNPPRNPSEALFTDFSYRVIGVPRNHRIPADADATFFDLGLCGPKRERVADDALCGAFKVPTLRNFGRKTFFMHNGFFGNKRSVVEFFATRDTNPTQWYPGGEIYNDIAPQYRGNVERGVAPFNANLNDAQIDALLAFLLTLTDGFGASHVPRSQ